MSEIEWRSGTVRIASSPLAGGKDTTVAYRAAGQGEPAVVFLHGGWGYGIYPLDTAIQRLVPYHQVLAPERSGHGRSSRITELPLDFHRRAVAETCAVLDTLGINRAVWWGHSDGAVIATLAALERPDRVEAAVLEALHLFKDKPRSRQFFEQMARSPEDFSPRVKGVLAADHGPDWKEVLRLDGEAWLGLAASATSADDDLYGGRLAAVDRPSLLIHGALDPRSEPTEFAAITAALPHATVALLAQGGHCPHSEAATADTVGQVVLDFLSSGAHQRPQHQQGEERRADGGDDDPTADTRELAR